MGLGVDHLAKHRTLGPRKHPPRFNKKQWCGALLLVAWAVAAASPTPRVEPTVDELKARVSSANVGEKAKLCDEIAQKQLAEADKFYAANDVEKAQAKLTDVVTYSELARDYSIQSHKHQKQIEISVRSMTRKLNDIVHTLGHDDQAPVKDAIDHLQRVRDDLLASMFPKGAK
jgi:hypothetical protein